MPGNHHGLHNQTPLWKDRGSHPVKNTHHDLAGSIRILLGIVNRFVNKKQRLLFCSVLFAKLRLYLLT